MPEPRAWRARRGPVVGATRRRGMGAARRRRQARADRARRPAAGFTLFEVVIALAIVLAFAALVLPAVDSLLEERAFASTGDVVAGQMLLARAHAQEGGRPVEVLYLPGRRVVQARLFAPAEADGLAGRAGPEGLALLPDDEDDAMRIAEPWAVRVLADAVRITDRRPQPEDDAGWADPLGGDLAASEWRDEDPDAPPLRLAVYLPDGSTLIRRDVWLVDDAGRVTALRVNPFTGRPALERVTGLTPPEEADDEELDDEFSDEDATDEQRPDGRTDRGPAEPASRERSGMRPTAADPSGEGPGPDETEDDDELPPR